MYLEKNNFANGDFKIIVIHFFIQKIFFCFLFAVQLIYNFMVATKKIKRKVSPKKSATAKNVAIGVSVAAVSLAAFLLSGSRGEKNRAKLKKMGGKMKKEIAGEIKKVKQISKKEYSEVIDAVVKKYKDFDKKDIEDFVASAKDHWDEVVKKTKTKKKEVKKRVVAKKKS